MDSHLTGREIGMKTWDWVASVVIAALLLLVFSLSVFGWGRDAVSKDCEHLGKFYNSGRIFECRLVADYTKES